jgi:DNA-binding LacI/PurR family transcriptional regulator
MGNIFRVARTAGVSVATVSRVFNQKPRVSDETRRKVMDAAVQVGYRPKYTARRDRILIVLEGGDHVSLGGYASELLMALTDGLGRSQLSYDILPIQQALLVPPNFIQGVLAVLYQPEHLAALDRIRDVPVVTVNRPRDSRRANRHAVYVNQRQGVGLALEHLAARGHRRVAFCPPGTGKSWAARERFAAYQDGVQRLGLDSDARLLPDADPSGEYFEALAGLLRAGATALLAPGEDVGLHINYAMYTLGRRVPDDLSVISYENATVSRFLTPPHTTVSQNLGHLGEQAVDVLRRVMSGTERKPVDMELPSALIERQSVKSLA